jgi:hypothetical protein
VRRESVTGIVTGELDIPAAVMVTVPEYVPTVKPVGFTLTVTEPGVEPELGETEIQEALSETE